MAKEIERKYLVRDTEFLSGLIGKKITQGYIADNPMTTRVRIMDDVAFLTLKGKTTGLSRDEFEYQIPLEDAEALLADYCEHRIVSKTRYLVPVGEHTFEVDVFSGKLDGLILAEVELLYEEEHFEEPLWLGKEVSTDFRFANSSLANTHNVPVFDEIVKETFLFAKNPAEGLAAIVIPRFPGHRFGEGNDHDQVKALLKDVEGTVILDLSFINGVTQSIFAYHTDDTSLAAKRVDKNSEELSVYAKLCAPLIKQHAKHLDFSLIYDKADVKALKAGKVPPRKIA